MENLDLHYILHGLIILLIGMLGGLPFAKAIKHNNGKEVAWRVVHSGGSMAGVMLIAVGSIINRITLSIMMERVIFFGFISATYALVIGMVLAAVSGKRGIGKPSVTINFTWRLVYGLYFIGAILSIACVTLLILNTGRAIF